MLSQPKSVETANFAAKSCEDSNSQKAAKTANFAAKKLRRQQQPKSCEDSKLFISENH
jgi:hypothetical protein